MGGQRPPATPGSVGAASLGMASENFGFSAVRLRRVGKLQFGVVNPDELVSFNTLRFIGVFIIHNSQRLGHDWVMDEILHEAELGTQLDIFQIIYIL